MVYPFCAHCPMNFFWSSVFPLHSSVASVNQELVPEDEREVILETLVPTEKSNIEYSMRAVLGKVI